MALKITITDAGRAELINADNTGTGPVEITHIALSGTMFTPNKTLKSLPGEIKRLSSIAGEVVADDTISVTAKDEGTDAYTVRGFGLITEHGTLFAVYSQEAPIIEKSGPTTLLLTTDIILADIDAANLTFGDISFSNPPASTTTPGVVRLSSALNSTAQNLAATPSAVKHANDNANTRLAKNQNLADLINAATARVNLGLGASATLGNTALRTSSSNSLLLQAAAMNDHRTSGDHDHRYPQRSNNLSDLPSPSQARSHLGLGASATMGTTASRTSTSTTTVLQAKGMNDHRGSGDHDGRYYQKNEFTDAATANAPMVRNSSGDVWARLFRSNYSSTNSNIAAIYTTQSIGGDYMRPSTPAQVMNAVGATRSISTGSGLTGGGNLAANRTLSVDSSVVRTSRAISTGSGLSGGGNLSANRTLSVDSSVVRTSRAINTGSGLSGGGNLSGNRTLSVDSTVARTSQFSHNARPSGYTWIAGNILIQWGFLSFGNISSGGTHRRNVTFPIAFPNGAWQAITSLTSGLFVDGSSSVSAENLVLTGFTAVYAYPWNGGNINPSISWIAIGN